MKLTKKFLEDKGACKEAIKWFCNQKETDLIRLIKFAIKKRDTELLSWANCRKENK